jgi:hypothetical protein
MRLTLIAAAILVATVGGAAAVTLTGDPAHVAAPTVPATADYARIIAAKHDLLAREAQSEPATAAPMDYGRLMLLRHEQLFKESR